MTVNSDKTTAVQHSFPLVLRKTNEKNFFFIRDFVHYVH